MNKDEELKAYLTKEYNSLKSLNFSEQYINDCIDLTRKWSKTSLLSGIDDTFVGRQVARLMENQLIFNSDSVPPDLPEDSGSSIPMEDYHEQWKRVSIPEIRRIFGNFLPYKLVSVQTLNSPQTNFHYMQIDGKMMSGIATVKTRNMGRYFWEGYVQDKYNLEEESLKLATMCRRYQYEVGKEIIKDLSKNAGSNIQVDYKDKEVLFSLIEGMSSYIAAKINGHDANWLITSPNIIELLKDKIDFVEVSGEEDEWDRISVKYRGMLDNKWAVYENPISPSDQILMGFKDYKNHYFSGYFYLPYLPCEPKPDLWKLDGSSHAHNYMLARYDKKLLNKNFYGLMKISNLPEIENKISENKEEEKLETIESPSTENTEGSNGV